MYAWDSLRICITLLYLYKFCKNGNFALSLDCITIDNSNAPICVPIRDAYKELQKGTKNINHKQKSYEENFRFGIDCNGVVLAAGNTGKG